MFTLLHQVALFNRNNVTKNTQLILLLCSNHERTMQGVQLISVFPKTILSVCKAHKN